MHLLRLVVGFNPSMSHLIAALGLPNGGARIGGSFSRRSSLAAGLLAWMTDFDVPERRP